jgi:hypothetical protein
MRIPIRPWLLWDQSTAVANARTASAELSRLRAEREEINDYLAATYR